MATSTLNLNHIAIEGGIGVGKTTLAQGLASKLNASLLLEDIDDNPFQIGRASCRERVSSPL